MKFIKGFMMGGIVSAGLMMMCTESKTLSAKKILKKGKKYLKI